MGEILEHLSYFLLNEFTFYIYIYILRRQLRNYLLKMNGL
jgi:hypothetical protein